ncbi:ClC family H(+)/Cl(-) exchange transporter [Synechococcus sp. BA-124 BA4]|uniref:ClC family H(+)/Cl(-) exchange transporter n=1 Tax=unclassified Synechococcus TaxID=2626047 RepID=UPI002AD4BB74|nr:MULTISPECIES: ClC family H(+)/Cl(-) exchange transporter [unclassified Synechococcus]MEA5399283.1 ClC family H(+)/Cl(-) exchange transporter [Synechococcus sp. BA-124 BA4]CAK6690478.1 H(+)/Cl(-) exchange transporter ClcA [Synechococcus sp. CBW1107]
MSVQPPTPRQKIRHLLRLFVLVNAIGIGVAVAIWVYGLEIQTVNALRLQLANHLPRWFVLPLMGLLGGGIAGALISGVEPGAKGSGIVQVMLWLRGVPVPMGWRVAVVKLLASGVAIGGGIPVGPEGPSIQIGASLARESADRLSRKDPQQSLAVAIGSGAGLAAVFHSPLGGAMYTIEELLKRSDVRTNAIATFATFATIAWTRLLTTASVGPAWLRELMPIIPYPSRLDDFRLVDVPILLVLGVLAGGLAVLYQRGILRLRLTLRPLRLEAWQLLPLVGLMIGLGWSLLPDSFDNPDSLDFDALLGLSTPSTALVALGVQGVGTAVAVAAEAPGGFLAPALVVGASLGTLVQQLCLLLFSYAPATLLFAGGGAFLGALTRTPLTAILLTFELSKNYALLLPIGFAVLTAIAVADQLERLTLFDVMLEEASPGSR